MDKFEDLMLFLTEYTESNSKMPKSAHQELLNMVQNYCEVEDERQMIEGLLRDLVEKKQALLSKHRN